MGVLLGVILGHLFDRPGRRPARAARVRTGSRARDLLPRSLHVMGHVAKSDGRVSEQDIAAARRIFRQFNLGEADTRAAMECFTQGKQPDFDAEAMLAELHQRLPRPRANCCACSSRSRCALRSWATA